MEHSIFSPLPGEHVKVGILGFQGLEVYVSAIVTVRLLFSSWVVGFRDTAYTQHDRNRSMSVP